MTTDTDWKIWKQETMTLEQALATAGMETEAQNEKRKEEWIQEERF